MIIEWNNKYQENFIRKFEYQENYTKSHYSPRNSIGSFLKDIWREHLLEIKNYDSRKIKNDDLTLSRNYLLDIINKCMEML